MECNLSSCQSPVPTQTVLIMTQKGQGFSPCPFYYDFIFESLSPSLFLSPIRAHVDTIPQSPRSPLPGKPADPNPAAI